VLLSTATEVRPRNATIELPDFDERLGDTQVAVDDVAAALGYAGVSPFMRSLRRWRCTTPADGGALEKSAVVS